MTDSTGVAFLFLTMKKSLVSEHTAMLSRNVPAPSPDGSRTQENAGGLGNLLKLASSKDQKPLKGNRDKTSNKVDESLNGSNKSVLSAEAIKDLPSADWEKVEVGTTLAFKILEMSSNYQPQISDFKIGSVTELDRATGELVVTLENSGEDTDEYDMTQAGYVFVVSCFLDQHSN